VEAALPSPSDLTAASGFPSHSRSKIWWDHHIAKKSPRNRLRSRQFFRLKKFSFCTSNEQKKEEHVDIFSLLYLDTRRMESAGEEKSNTKVSIYLFILLRPFLFWETAAATKWWHHKRPSFRRGAGRRLVSRFGSSTLSTWAGVVATSRRLLVDAENRRELRLLIDRSCHTVACQLTTNIVNWNCNCAVTT